MADEIGGLNLEEGGGVRGDVNKVTEEAVRRVQDDSKKAQQVGQQIQKDKAVNDKLANFLGILLKSIKDEAIIKGIYEVFFKTKNPDTDITYIRKNINTPLVVGIFVPFYHEEVSKQGLEEMFNCNLGSNITLTKYTSYIKGLLSKNTDNTPVDKHHLIDFLIKVAINYGLVSSKLTNEAHTELKQTLSKELYGHSIY